MVAIAVGAAVSIGGAALSSGAQKHAADTASAEQAREYDQAREDYAPYRQVGSGALYKLADMYGVPRPTTNGSASGAYGGGAYGLPGGGSVNIPGMSGGGSGMTPGYEGFQASPGYQWRRDQGLQAIDRGKAARGLLGSGAAVKAEQTYGDGLASAEYEIYANHLASLAGIGQSATAGTAAAGQASADAQGKYAMAAGDARASSYAGGASAINQSINSYLGYRQFQQMQNKMPDYSISYADDANYGMGALY